MEEEPANAGRLRGPSPRLAEVPELSTVRPGEDVGEGGGASLGAALKERQEIAREGDSGAMQALLSLGGRAQRKSKNGRRKRRRRPGSPKGSKNKTS